MGIKEIYEEMSDEELLERYSEVEKYFENAQEILIDEIRKRNLVREEEIEKKLDGIKIRLSNTICRKAASWVNAVLKPAHE